jgi:hypothetical protein
VDLGAHFGSENVEDEALARDARQSGEAIRDDRGAEVAAARRRSDVPRVQVTLVGDVDVARRELRAQSRLDVAAPVHREQR